MLRIPITDVYRKILKSEIDFNDYLAKEMNVLIPKYIYLSEDNSFGIYNYIVGEKLNKFDNIEEEEIVITQLAEFLEFDTI